MRFALLTAALFTASAASAQDFRVYTVVRETSEGPVLSRSLTLFHAGKTYDYIEAIGEVVIAEPSHRRFTLIRGGAVGTRVTFDELSHFRRVGGEETHSYARQLAADPTQSEAAAALRFPLNPAFETTFEGDRLRMAAPVWKYDVRCSSGPGEEYAAAYLDYADRAAGLNFVLHPQSYFPAAREALNAELRERTLVPTRIKRTVQLGGEQALSAEHRFEWTLQSFDRSQIQKWERMAESDTLEWVNFRNYQTRLMAEN